MELETSLVEEATSTQCKACSTPSTSLDSFCQNCGFPLKETEEEQNTFIYARDYRSYELDQMNRKIRSAGNTIFILAGVFALMGIIYFLMLGEAQGGNAILVVNLILAGIYVGLGFWSKQNAIAAIVSALVLFGVVQILNIIEDPTSIFKGIIMKVVVIVYLIKGLNSALDAQKIRKQYNL